MNSVFDVFISFYKVIFVFCHVDDFIYRFVVFRLKDIYEMDMLNWLCKDCWADGDAVISVVYAERTIKLRWLSN